MIDPIDIAVLQRRLKSITEEIGLTLLRTTRSPILNEARDFATGLYDAGGRMLEQTEYVPVLAFALQPAVEQVVATFGDDVFPGDVFLHNDVFSGGNQNNDVAVIRPIFVEGRLVAWAACKGHQADIGGSVIGGYNPEAREVWQEALRIPALKVFDRGRRRDDVWSFIFANIRLKVVEEDIKAQIGATQVGLRGVEQLISRIGVDAFREQVESLYDSTEKKVRSEIAAIPNGTYHGSSYAFYDGVNDGSKMLIDLHVTVKDGEITFDLSGSSPQTPGFVNAPFSACASALILTFLMLIDADIPHNAGLLRPIKIVNPPGSFLNAKYPAATTFGNSLTGPVSDAIFRAFAAALPKMITAGWNRFFGISVAGRDERHGRSYSDILFLSQKGGSGGTWMADGYDHIGLINCAGGILAQDYEMFEIQNPHFLLKHEFATDSAGAGQWRGGLGIETEFRMDGSGVTAVCYGDGIEPEAKAFGVFEGKPGCANEIEFRTADGKHIRPKAKQIIRNLGPGTVLRQIAGGGGGYGPPHRRPADVVLEDVRNGFVSVARARDDYGVVIDPDTMTLNAAATKALRERVA